MQISKRSPTVHKSGCFLAVKSHSCWKTFYPLLLLNGHQSTTNKSIHPFSRMCLFTSLLFFPQFRSLRNDLTFSLGVVLLFIPTVITCAASFPKVRDKEVSMNGHSVFYPSKAVGIFLFFKEIIKINYEGAPIFPLFDENVDFLAQTEYSYFSAVFRLKIFLYYS